MILCGMGIIETISLEKKKQYRFCSLSKLRFIRKLTGYIILLASLKTSSLYLFMSDDIHFLVQHVDILRVYPSHLGMIWKINGGIVIIADKQQLMHK